MRSVKQETQRSSAGGRVINNFRHQVVIPEITEKVQAELKECLENFTGIIVEYVHVVVCDSTAIK